MGGASSLGRHGKRRFAVTTAIAAVLALAALAVSMSERGDAAFPGTNGRIAYSYGDAYDGSIWSANADGSVPTKLTSGANDFGPAYSADGGRIAFHREGGVDVMNADGSGLTQLAAGQEGPGTFDPKWLEDYVVADAPGGPRTIPVVKIETFTQSWHLYQDPSFSPDGSQLAVSESSGNVTFTSTCAVAAEGSQKCLEYEDPDAYFDYEQHCDGCGSHIITISSTSGARTGEVTPLLSWSEDYEPTYSAGGKIAFARRTASQGGIFIVNSPGAVATPLTSGREDYGPDFSPDGSRVVFNRQGREFGLVGVGGGPVSLLPIPKAPGAAYTNMESPPSFSPDGTRLVFQRNSYFLSGPAEHALLTMGLDGSGLGKVVDGGYGPSWQPVPSPPPPPAPPLAKPVTFMVKKGLLRLNKKNQVIVGKISCGSSLCKLKLLSTKLTAGKKKCSAKIKLPKTLASGKSANVKVTVTGKCLAALKKAHKGALLAKIRVKDAVGQEVLTFRSTLAPSEAKGKGKKK
jgi:Tol biopolymer transport system component